jgi:hypothetical protein
MKALRWERARISQIIISWPNLTKPNHPIALHTIPKPYTPGALQTRITLAHLPTLTNNEFLWNFEGAYLGEKLRPNKNKTYSELMSSRAIPTQKIAKIGFVPINCNLALGWTEDTIFEPELNVYSTSLNSLWSRMITWRSQRCLMVTRCHQQLIHTWVHSLHSRIFTYANWYANLQFVRF